MQRKRHPNHHLPPLLIGVASAMGFMTMLVVLGIVMSDDRNLYFMIMGAFAVAESIAIFIVISQLLKNCQCPGCGAALKREANAMEHGIQFPCESCNTVWVSKIGGGSVES